MSLLAAGSRVDFFGPPNVAKPDTQVIDISDMANPLLVSVVERVTADMASHVAVDCALV